jgi:hypothetical protein
MNSIIKYLALITSTYCIFSCSNEGYKGEHRYTIEICKDIYLEVYRTFGSGALGSDIMCDYLTDSLNFRVCIGELDDGIGHFSYNCSADSIFVAKLEMEEKNGSFHVLENKIYDMKKLKTLHNISQQKIKNISDDYLFTIR